MCPCFWIRIVDDVGQSCDGRTRAEETNLRPPHPANEQAAVAQLVDSEKRSSSPFPPLKRKVNRDR